MQRYLPAAGLGLAILLSWMLAASLGRLQVATQLRQQAEQQRLLAQRGQPSWHWDLQRPRQLLAGHAFGAVTASADPQGLRLQARSNQAYQLGLRLSGPIALWPGARWQLDYHASQLRPIQIRLIAVDPARNACYSPAWTLPPGTQASWQLPMQAWHDAHGLDCQPGVALALRLVVQSAPGAGWQLRRLALFSPPRSAATDAPPLTLPAARAAALTQLSLAASTHPRAVAPEVGLAAATPAVRLLQLRDAIRLHWPDAIIRPQAHMPAIRLPAPWLMLVVYAVVLLALLRVRPADRGWAQALASVVGPLWLIVGMHFGQPDPGPSAIAAGLGLAAAIWLGWPLRHDWRWLGSTLADWLRPLAIVPLALLLSLGWGGPLHAPKPGHILAYLAWASLQQLWMLGMVWPLLRRRLPGTLALVLTAAIFMLLHTPNSQLMQACLLAELYWVGCFQRDRRLLPVALGHASAALLLQAGAGPAGLLRSLEVSARYLH